MAVKHRRLPNGQYVPVDNVEDNLNAAATPISVEPVAGGEEELGDEGQHAILMQQLISQGVPLEQARVIAGREVIRRQSAAADERAQARVASGYKDPRQTAYNAATGADGYGFDDEGNPAFLGQVDIRNPAQSSARERERRAYSHNAPYNSEMDYQNNPRAYAYYPEGTAPAPVAGEEPAFADSTVPGPRTLDGKPPTPSRGLNAEEAEAYNTRKPGQLSQADRDMAARGLVPVVTPDGVRYMASAATGGPGGGPLFPGGPGRAGDGRPDLTDKGWIAVERRGPDGRVVMVYEPGPKIREKQAADLKARQAAYQQKKARMDAEREAARQHWRATAMLAGGSQNLNSGNRWIADALVGMKPDDRDAAIRYMLPGGELHARVDAANAERAAKMAEAAILGSLRNAIPNPMQEAAREQQELQQNQDMVAWAEKNINDRYAYDADSWSGWLGLSDFSQAERQQAIDDLMTQFHGSITLAEATRIVDNIASRKRAPGAAQPAQAPPLTASRGNASRAAGGLGPTM